MTNEEFIKHNRNQDVRSLALKKMPEGVDALWCLRQIEGYQLARRKLPQWAETEGIWYPPRLSMEQCSSEATALYKQNIARRIASLPYSITDITGGFGVDFSYMAQGAAQCTYMEQQQVLCEAARHNMPLLGLGNAEIVMTNSASCIIKRREGLCNVVFADPARRDDTGRKTVAIEDCTPDICSLQDSLLANADYLIVKLSPMLDITQALRGLRNVTEVHVVSVKGECKELLFVLATPYIYNKVEGLTYYCVNIDTQDEDFSCSDAELQDARETVTFSMPQPGMFLSEPNASVLKAGTQEAFARKYALTKLHPHSNLYLSDRKNEAMCARQFRITAIYDFSKASIRLLQQGNRQANLTIRNFPSTVAELRKRLKIKEGGSNYLFATTLYDDSHAIIQCEK